MGRLSDLRRDINKHVYGGMSLADAVQRVKNERSMGMAKYTGAMIGRCAVRGCNHTVKRDSRTYIDWNGDRCEKHPRWPLIWKAVKGTVNIDHVCDERCTHAKGNNCECACGGANHGNAYL